VAPAYRRRPSGTSTPTPPGRTGPSAAPSGCAIRREPSHRQAQAPAGCRPAATRPAGPSSHQQKREGVQGGAAARTYWAPHHITRPKNRPPVGPDLARVNTGVERGLGRVDVGRVPTPVEDVGGGAETGVWRRAKLDVRRRGGWAAPDVSGDLFLPTSRDIQRNCEMAQWWSGVLRGRVVSLYDLSA
jgi:hypothetical protein